MEQIMSNDQAQRLASLMIMIISIPGASVVLDRLPNGREVIGFRWTKPEGK